MTRSRIHTLGGWSLALMLLAACGGERGDAPPPAESAPPAPEPAAAPPAPQTPPPQAAAATPETFRVLFETSKGNFTVEVQRSLSPNGADRFYALVNENYYDGVRFFRVIPGFMAQFGMHGDPAVGERWRQNPIQDDPVVGSNTRGTITFAKTGAPNSRTSQLFINLVDRNGPMLDGQGFAPFGRVIDEGMAVVDQLYGGYGEGAPQGNGPTQPRITAEGNAYLEREFPLLDYIVRARVVG